MAEKFFWADKIAEQIIKERGKGKKEFVCASGITPSGTIHIGNFREVITTELVVKALQDKGKKVRFIYSWDDYDRFRKVPANLPKSKKQEYEKYIGMPLSEIPSPFNKKKTYAQYFEEEFENSLKKVGIKPEFIQQNIMNKKCRYAELIKLAVDKKEEIIEVLNKYRKEPLAKNWYPVDVYCEKCKKNTTKVLGVDGYILEYECKCGFKNKIDFRKKGIVKAPWRVDWPMRWKYEGVVFEPGGIDHSVYGGSYMTSKEIVKKVFDFEAPIYQFYEWVKIKGGGAFSSSIGNVLTVDEVEEIYEPEVLRYIFTGTRPNKSFQISFDNDVIKIYEDYDRLEEKYYNRKTNPQEKRIYELSQIIETNKIPKTKPKKTSFKHLITLVQAGRYKNLKGRDKIRAEKVKNWLKKYAGDEMKFEIQKKVSGKVKSELNKKQKQALVELRKVLGEKGINEKKLFNEFYNICEKVKIKNSDFFVAVYKVIIGKTRGPRLAPFILDIGKEKIIKLLREI